MFGLFGSKNPRPLELEGTTTILAPASLIFGLLDFARPDSRLRQRKFEFTQESANLGPFSAIDPAMRDLRFDFNVDLYEPDRAYGFDTRIVAEEAFGAFDAFREEYYLEETQERTCRVTLKTICRYRVGLSRRIKREEEVKMTQSVVNDLVRLKSEAEARVSESDVER
jgi:hypothetical protein